MSEHPEAVGHPIEDDLERLLAEEEAAETQAAERYAKGVEANDADTTRQYAEQLISELVSDATRPVVKPTGNTWASRPVSRKEMVEMTGYTSDDKAKPESITTFEWKDLPSDAVKSCHKLLDSANVPSDTSLSHRISRYVIDVRSAISYYNKLGIQGLEVVKDLERRLDEAVLQASQYKDRIQLIEAEGESALTAMGQWQNACKARDVIIVNLNHEKEKLAEDKKQLQSTVAALQEELLQKEGF